MPKTLPIEIIETDKWTISKRAVNNELHKVDFSAVWLKANADDYPSTFEGMSRMLDDLMKILPCLPYKVFGVPQAKLIPGARDAKHNPIYYELYIWGRKEIIKPSIVLSPKNK